MKSDSRHITTLGQRFRFGIRALGLTGLLALAIGAMLTPETGWNQQQLVDSAKGAFGLYAQVVAVMVLAGAGLVVILVLVELLGLIFQSAGRKTAEGTNAALQIVLALGLLFVVNAVSFQHYWRKDVTRDHRFSIEPELQERLKKLDPESPTKVIVLQRDKTSSIEPDNPGALEAAAQAKVVEKVRDIVDELREFGPRFQITVLATRDEQFESKLNELTQPIAAADPKTESSEAKAKREKDNGERELLKSAIENAPENSVFFAANGRVQRIGFNEFYMLDKTASLSRANPEKRNLALVPQGKAAFIDKVLALEERAPKIALLAIHPVLTSEGDPEEYSGIGIRKSLEMHGFDVTDVILKRWPERGTLVPAADALSEQKLTELEESLPSLQFGLSKLEDQIEQISKVVEDLKSHTAVEINKLYKGRLPVFDDEDDRKSAIEQLSSKLYQFRKVAKDRRKQMTKDEAEYAKLLGDDRAVENLRTQNVKAKLEGYVRDCDALIVPRLTIMALNGRVLQGWWHSMNKDQADVIRGFIKAGKPVLFAMGPTVTDTPEPNESANDDIEKMLARLGIDLGADAIITDDEVTAISSRSGSFASPPDPFKMKTYLELPSQPLAGKAPNPVATAYRAAAHSVDADLDPNREDESTDKREKITERKRVVFSVARNGGYRSIVVAPPTLAGMKFSPEILRTVEKSWNESKPLREQGYIPTFDPPRPDDRKKGGREDEVMKSYPVGVAVEVKIPAEWNDPKLAVTKFCSDAMGMAPGLIGFPSGLATAVALTPDALAPATGKTERLVVFGHGGLFVGKTLDPGRQTLLLNSMNWLLNRTDRMPVDKPDGEKWRYPRVSLAPERLNLWGKVTRFGLPAVAIYLCFMVLMVRRFR